MENGKPKMGRKPLPPNQKKKLFRFYVSPAVVSMVGGDEKLKEYLNQVLLKKAVEVSEKELKEIEQQPQMKPEYWWRK